MYFKMFIWFMFISGSLILFTWGRLSKVVWLDLLYSRVCSLQLGAIFQRNLSSHSKLFWQMLAWHLWGASHSNPFSAPNEVHHAFELFEGASKVVRIAPTFFVIKLVVNFYNPVGLPLPASFGRKQNALFFYFMLSFFVFF